MPFPFAACFYFSADDYALLWGKKVHPEKPRTIRAFLGRVVSAIRQLPPCTLYAHNGGKFDFHYLIEFADAGGIIIRNGRIVEMRIGNAILKDSWPLLPFPLAEYQKTKIDYGIFRAHLRNRPANRAKIEAYLLDDCRDLLTLVTGFREIVGPKDTIGSAAFYQMRRAGIKIQNMNETHDDMFRPYYFGGRVEAMEKGDHRGNFRYFDINSAYPRAMLEKHAHGAEYVYSERMPRRSRLVNSFLRVDATSEGALPLRADDGGLSFPHTRAEFFATGWEIAAGLDTGTLKVHSVRDCWTPLGFICWKEYVEHFYAARLDAKKRGDLIRALAYKYLLNSGYGKFAQNPREFKRYRLAPFGKNVPGYDWETDFGAVSLWSQPSFGGWGFYDVATAASITGYVRAMLWHAINVSRGVVYVDTDSMICKASNVKLGTALGEWKDEGRIKRAAIAGKKLYGIEWEHPEKGVKYRVASKGARLSFAEILTICGGDSVQWVNAAPTFTLGNPHFIKREIRAT